MFYTELEKELKTVGIEGEKLERVIKIVKECEIK